MVIAILGWAFIAFNIYWMATAQRVTPQIWDPYEILGVDTVGSEGL